MKKIIACVIALAAAGALTFSGAAQDRSPVPLLIEQRIVQIELEPDFADGIEWDLLEIFLDEHRSTTGLFPLAERARHRLSFRPMRKTVPPARESNVDFETVEQVRIQQFSFGEIWEDTRRPREAAEDLRFGSIRIYKFQPVMDFLRRYGEARVLFHRKWVTDAGEQTMLSSFPEVANRDRRGAAPQEVSEGSRLTIRPEVAPNNLINFHLDSKVSTIFYVDPYRYPRLPRVKRGEEEVAKRWETFRLNTKGVLESGSTAIFEDIRDGRGIIVFITADILETHRKLLQP